MAEPVSEVYQGASLETAVKNTVGKLPMSVVSIGSHGNIHLPTALRRKLHLKAGDKLFIIEAPSQQGLLLCIGPMEWAKPIKAALAGNEEEINEEEILAQDRHEV